MFERKTRGHLSARCRRAAVLAVAVLSVAPAAHASTGRPSPTGVQPPNGSIALTATRCVVDGPHVRVWWSDAPGALNAIAGVDGSCATVPPAAEDTLAAAERFVAASAALGFPTVSGDARPLIVKRPDIARQLLRLTPARRAALLRRSLPIVRGRILAGFTAAQRVAVLRGLPRSLRVRLLADQRLAITGRKQDFIGGDTRLDIVLHASKGTLAAADGVTACFTAPVAGKPARFVGASVIVLTTGSANLPTLAHELFHVVQCGFGRVGTSAGLLVEGTAEWHAAAIEPGGFAGTVTTDPLAGTSIAGGAARAASFCTDFDPSNVSDLDRYEAWPIWMVLERTAPGTIRRALERAVTNPLPDAGSVLAYVGDGPWSSALLQATVDVCGNLRSPSGLTSFPPATRGFFAFTNPIAQPGTPASAPIAPGGVRSVRATWGSATPASVTVNVAVTGAAPPGFAARVVAAAGGAPVPVTEVPGGVSISIPADRFASRDAVVTIASPSIAAATSIAVSVVET